MLVRKAVLTPIGIGDLQPWTARASRVVSCGSPEQVVRDRGHFQQLDWRLLAGGQLLMRAPWTRSLRAGVCKVSSWTLTGDPIGTCPTGFGFTSCLIFPRTVSGAFPETVRRQFGDSSGTNIGRPCLIGDTLHAIPEPSHQGPLADSQIGPRPFGHRTRSS